MGSRRLHGVIGSVVALALGVSVVGAPSAGAAEVKVKLPKGLEAEAGFPLNMPIKVQGASGLVNIDWGNGETDQTYTNECSYSSSKPVNVCTATAEHTYYSPGDYTVTVTAVDEQFSETGERSVTPADTRTTVVSIGGPAVPKPFDAWRMTDVQISGLPEFVAAPVTFTVSATRTDAVPACSAELGHAKLDGPGPWQFTYDPVAAEHEVVVHFCDGGHADEYLRAEPVFELNGPELVNLTGEHAGKTHEEIWRVSSPSGLAAMVELVNKGSTMASAELPAGGSAEVKQKFKAKDFPTGSTNLTVRATGADGSVMQWPITLAKGWSGFGRDIDPTFTPCSTVTWSYSEKGAPKSTAKMRKTTRQAFKKLGRKTGLEFVEAKPGDGNADVRIGWGNLQQYGSSIAGVGGPAGDITLSNTSFWLRDSYAGLGKNSGRGVPGNGWLILHEALHVLGLGHTDTHGELMSSRGYRDLAAFGKGDSAAIEALYRPSTCG